ncbi:uncharacterized protein [Battus philenor]|uniref:uncharacterized protein n=1 Tax=Battus philenor TaxID=42288 RepID=UPI0035CF018F
MSSKTDIKKKDISKRRLIRVIKENSIIWDRNNPGYKDRAKRGVAWREVFQGIVPDYDKLSKSDQKDIGDRITKKWYYLRDSYAKSRKNVRFKRPYQHGDMSFLDLYYVDENNSETESNNTEYRNVDDSNSIDDVYDRSLLSEEDFFMDDILNDETIKKTENSLTELNVVNKNESTLSILKAKVITVELIKLVEEKKLLWDKTCSNYKDRVKRDIAWREIFKAIEPKFDELQESEKNEIGDYIAKKWYNVRDAYLKNIKHKRPYIYSDLLKFLDPHILDRNNSEIEYCDVKETQNIDDCNSVVDSEDGSINYQERKSHEVDDDIFETPNKKFKYNAAMFSTPELIRKTVSSDELIKIIKKKRLLWDRSCSDYNHREKREEAWREVCKAIVPNYDKLLKITQREIGFQISKKWFNIRDNYVKSLKNSGCKRPYVHSEMLTFLDAQYYNRNNSESECNTSNDFKMGDGSVQYNKEETRHFKQVFLDVDDEMFESATDKCKVEVGGEENDPNLDSNDREKKLISMLGSLIAREDDEDRSFFNAILSSVKALSDDSKLEFRIKVLELIQSLKEQDGEKINIKLELIRTDSED